MPNRSRRLSATIRPVVTISAVESTEGTWLSGMWMVTGTVLSAGPASIITGVMVLPVLSDARWARYSVCPGKAKPAS